MYMYTPELALPRRAVIYGIEAQEAPVQASLATAWHQTERLVGSVGILDNLVISASDDPYQTLSVQRIESEALPIYVLQSAASSRVKHFMVEKLLPVPEISGTYLLQPRGKTPFAGYAGSFSPGIFPYGLEGRWTPITGEHPELAASLLSLLGLASQASKQNV